MTVPVRGFGSPVRPPVMLRGRPLDSNKTSSAPPNPLQFLENRDLFFSSHSVRASVEPFLNQPERQRLYLSFSLPENASPLTRLLHAPQAVVVLDRVHKKDDAQSPVTLHVAYYDANHGEAINPWTPWPSVMQPDDPYRDPSRLAEIKLPFIERVMNAMLNRLQPVAPIMAARLSQMLLPQRHAKESLRLPGGLQSADVLYSQAPQVYAQLQSNKALRQRIKEDVLSAVNQLEEQGYVLRGQQLEPALSKSAMTTAAVADNPFRLMAEEESTAASVLQPV